MNHDELNQQSLQEDQSSEADQEVLREWVQPAFERMTLKEAMTSNFVFPNPVSDGILYYS